MIDFKAAAGGFAIMGSLGLAALGIGSGVANAEPSPPAPQVTSSYEAGQAPGSATPSPYAAYGDASICAMPGLYFVNVCS